MRIKINCIFLNVKKSCSLLILTYKSVTEFLNSMHINVDIILEMPAIKVKDV